MTPLSVEMREALERVPDEWALPTSSMRQLAELGLIEVCLPDADYRVRRTPAGRLALSQSNPEEKEDG